MKPKTIRVTCKAAGTLPLEKLSPLQGDLKALTEENHARGRQKKRGHEHFWTEGAKIENAASIGDDPYYTLARKTRFSPEPEGDMFDTMRAKGAVTA
jgi:hypothetical protein